MQQPGQGLSQIRLGKKTTVSKIHSLQPTNDAPSLLTRSCKARLGERFTHKARYRRGYLEERVDGCCGFTADSQEGAERAASAS